MLSPVVSLTSALLAMTASNRDHQNASLIRKLKAKKGKANVYKKASSLCTSSSWLYTANIQWEKWTKPCQKKRQVSLRGDSLIICNN